jgi:DNA-binding LacI/PurR family transcriptional regulator
VEVDNEGGAYQAIKHLLELGHRRIGVLTGLETISTQVVRVNGYKRALKEAGISIDETLIVNTASHFYSNQPQHPNTPSPNFLTNLQMTPNAFQALHQLLDLPERPTAIFVTNNQMTLGTFYALKERNLQCPEEISVISFDDHDWAPLFSPSLTVVRQPTYELGQAAAQLLMKLINKESIEGSILLPVELIIRGSCKVVEVL